MPILDDQVLLSMPDDVYMNEDQLNYFRLKLQAEKAEISHHLQELKASLSQHERDSDELDQAAFEEELRLQLRQADRESRLIGNIDSALRRIDSGEYGYCEETGDPIGLPRLLLRPTAKLSLDAKERQERREHSYRKVRGG